MKELSNTIRYHADFNQRVVIYPDNYQWQPSPMPGVERMMLDRIGNEVARATSLPIRSSIMRSTPGIGDGCH